MAEKMVEKKIRSALPIYIAAAAFLIGSCIFSAYTLSGLLLAGALAAAAYAVAGKKIPPPVGEGPPPAQPFARGGGALEK